MILIDLNQVLLAGLMAQIANQKNSNLDEDLIRHLVLNIIRMHVKNFRKEYGEVVLCCDNRNYWRKEFFPFYKAGRKKAREKSDLDWHIIFDMLAKFKQELRENFPYKVIDVEGAEADDIIGTLVPRHIMHENILIISSDGDFLQLQQWNNYLNCGHIVKQYNPAQKKFIISEDPVKELKMKIINGESKISLRIVDWFVTNYSKKNFTVYETQQNTRFKVYHDYKLKLKAYSKKRFDPFCRWERISIWISRCL